MITRRRRSPATASTASELSPHQATPPSYPQRNHHHRHHHYHHHIHHHFFTERLNEVQNQRTVSFGNDGSRNQQTDFFNNMLALDNEFYRLNVPRTTALLRSRQNQGDDGRPLEELGYNFDDRIDELLEEVGIGEWLAAAGIDEDWVYVGSQSFNPCSSSLGLSKAAIEELPMEVFRSNGTGTSEQDECPVCLDHFLSGQQLICLPCNHKFHYQCLIPWLTDHSQCPSCRAKINAKKRSDCQGTVCTDDVFDLMEAVDSGMSRLSIR